MINRRLIVALWLVGTLTLLPSALAQGNRIDVFLELVPGSSAANVYFMDALSGLSTVVRVDNGHKFTLVGDYVLYEKTQSGAIMRATLAGLLEPHPFIRRGVETRAVRWVVSPDRQAVAWVLVDSAGVSEAYTAWADGRDLRQLPISTPAAPLELAPLALTNGLADFFYDMAQPAGDEAGAFTIYAHVARYSLVDEAFYPLPGEPNCPCSASLSSDGRLYARLEAPDGVGPFGLHLWDLRTGAGIAVLAPDLPYRLAGDLILSSTGTFAAYTTAAGPESGLAEEQYSLVLVDVVTAQQYAVLPPDTTHYCPLAFIDGDRALLLVDPAGGATYKLDLVNRELTRVSDKLYLGTIITSAGSGG